MASGDFRDRLLEGLGGDWPAAGPLEAKTLKVEELEGGIRRERITYRAEAGDEELPHEKIVTAYLLLPPGASSDKPAPGICVWHQHNGAWHLTTGHVLSEEMWRRVKNHFQRHLKS